MKCYTFSAGRISEGIAVEESKIGLFVFLGEEGRGRQYEKVGFFPNSPAEVKKGRVYEAHPVKITINRGTEREKCFYALAKPNTDNNDQRVLVRVSTYRRDVVSVGGWQAIKGQPQDFVVGYGAYGDDGENGRWADGLVIMAPRDVICIKEHYALSYDAEGLCLLDLEVFEIIDAANSKDAEIEFL